MRAGGSGRPHALTRVRRQPLAVLSLAVLGALAMGSAGLSDALRVRLTGTVDANWRGAYDILVRPSGRRLDLEQTNGVVEPNFLSFGGRGGITEAQLATIRQIPGVEVAAPVGFVGYLRYTTSAPTVQVTKLPTHPTLYVLTISMATNDGRSDLLISRERGSVLLGPLPSGPNPQVPWSTDLGRIGYGLDADGNPNVEISAGHALPAIATPVLAVDPVAEAALLGPTAGFLRAFDPVANQPQLDVEHTDLNLIPPQFDYSRTQLRALQAPQYPDKTAKQRPVIPLVVSDQLYTSLKLSLEVSQVGQPLRTYPAGDTPDAELEAARKEAGPGLAPLGVSSLDATALLAPLQPTALVLGWPGSDPTGGATTLQAVTGLDTRVSDRPGYSAMTAPSGGSDLSFRIAPRGVVGPDGGVPVTGLADDPSTSGYETGSFPAYRTFNSLSLALPEEGAGSVLDASFILAPLGTFDLHDLDLPTNPLTSAPLGAYAAPDTELIAGPDGSPASVALRPTINSAGLLTMPPLALTNIAAAVRLRGDHPIDAIRVRVAGLDGFDSQAQAKVEAIASQIASLGLDVDIVAGASPQAVDIYVPAYDTSATPAGDLGWVQQGWTTIGAAQRVETGFGSTNLSLIGLATGSALLFAVGLQTLAIDRRRRELAILRAIGWSRSAIARWIGGEALVAFVAIALLAIAGWWLGGRSIFALAIGLLIAGVSLVSTFAVAAVAARRGDLAGAPGGELKASRHSRFVAIRGPVSYELRLATARSGGFALETLGVGVTAATAALAALVIGTAAERAGPTFLAAAVGAIVGPFALLILGATTLGGLAFAVATSRAEVRARRREMQVLESTGWSRKDRRAVLLLGRSFVAIPAAFLGWAGLVVGGAILGMTAAPWAVGAAVAVAATAAIGPMLWLGRRA